MVRFDSRICILASMGYFPRSHTPHWGFRPPHLLHVLHEGHCFRTRSLYLVQLRSRGHSRLGYYFWDKGLKDSGYLGTFRVFFVFTKKWFIPLPEGVLPVASPNMPGVIRASRATVAALSVVPTQQRQHSSVALLQSFQVPTNFQFLV
jgi:hypothetical protein